MPRVVHFEIAADDPERAVDFYRDVFGWQIQKWDSSIDYWLIQTGEEEAQGIDGALMRRDEAAAGTVNTIDVPSIDEFSERVAESGGRIVAAKTAVPGVGWFAYCQDPEGNTFGIMEFDDSVAG